MKAIQKDMAIDSEEERKRIVDMICGDPGVKQGFALVETKEACTSSLLKVFPDQHNLADDLLVYLEIVRLDHLGLS